MLHAHGSLNYIHCTYFVERIACGPHEILASQRMIPRLSVTVLAVCDVPETRVAIVISGRACYLKSKVACAIH